MAKLFYNSVLSTSNSTTFMATNLKDFYIVRPMTSYGHMHIPIGMVRDAIILEQYNLLPPLAHKGHSALSRMAPAIAA